MLKRFSFISFFGLLALVAGGLGQFLLTSNRLIPAAILYALAVVLVILAFRQQPGPKFELSAFLPSEPGRIRQWGYIAGGLAIGFAILSFALFATSISPVYPWLFHLASIALLIVSTSWVDRRKKQNTPRVHSWSWLEIGILLLIFAIAAFMRLYRFDQIPFGTWFDEADNGLNALKIINEPGYLPVFVESTNLPAHFLYLIALSFRILGVSTLSIRAVSVVFGLGTVAAAFLTGQELFNRKMGLVIAFMLAVSRWDVNWSRIGMHGITVPFFELLTVGLVLRALRRQRLMDYALAGLSIGFGLCFYTPLRLFPFVIGLLIVMLLINRRKLIRSYWRGILIYCLGSIIASIPIIYLVTFQPDEFFSRMENVSIFMGKTPQEGWQAVAKTTSEHLLMFNYQGDRNGRHNLPGTPMLDPITGVLMVLGAGLCLWRIRQPGSFLLLVWLLLMLAPGIFSLDFESPQSLRAIGSLPAAYLLAAVPIHGLWQEWEKLSKNHLNIFFLILFTLVLGISGAINFNIYFNQQAQTFDSWSAFSTPETIAAKVMAEMGNNVEFYLSTYYYQTPTIQFLAPTVTNYHRWDTYDTLPVSSDGKKGVIFLVDATQEQFFLQAKSYYPSATFKEFTAPNGTPVLYEIYLKPSDILASQGLTASYYHGTSWSGQPFLVRTENNLDFDLRDGDPAPFPFSVEWKGILFADIYGNYKIFLHSPAPIEMTIDEVPIAFQDYGGQTADVLLAKGCHTIRIRTQGMAGHYELDWQPPSGQITPIPASALLLPPITNNGLLGRFYANPQWEGTPTFTQINPWIGFYFQITPLPRPYTVEWVGSIYISSGGQYLFGLESTDESSLWIGKEQVVNDLTSGQYQEAAVDLAPGFQTIRVRYVDRTSYTHIYLYWTPPGGDREIIPQKVLFPPQGDPELIKPIEDPGLGLLIVPSQSQSPSTTQPTILSPVLVKGNIPELQDIDAKLIWKTGECGSRLGQFQSPHGISLDHQGNIWIADTGNHRVVEIDPQGHYVRSFGQAGDGIAQFHTPFDLLVEHDGNLVILDSENTDALKRFSATGDFITAFGSDLVAYNPRGMGIDSEGNLYLADTGKNRILRISKSGAFLQQWIIDLLGDNSSQPVSITTTGDSTIYFADAINGLIVRLSPDGKSVAWPAFAPSDTLSGPYITIGPKSNIYVTDPKNKRVDIYSQDGQPIGQIHSTDGQTELMLKPVGITIGADGVLYVSGHDLCQILAFKLPDALIK